MCVWCVECWMFSRLDSLRIITLHWQHIGGCFIYWTNIHRTHTHTRSIRRDVNVAHKMFEIYINRIWFYRRIRGGGGAAASVSNMKGEMSASLCVFQYERVAKMMRNVWIARMRSDRKRWWENFTRWPILLLCVCVMTLYRYIYICFFFFLFLISFSTISSQNVTIFFSPVSNFTYVILSSAKFR